MEKRDQLVESLSADTDPPYATAIAQSRLALGTHAAAVTLLDARARTLGQSVRYEPRSVAVAPD
ncbi:hypothetical protein KZ813_16680 [Sphingomonas sp. RHCKR7]|uniref:hypothetical protein n=1 Tax=Sphingomonas folli TaxID=2862497 RepID=UPI001CA5DA95|nr:hypothetical protein [Sphingomonas folli]MBW6528481.1 hypothetical protein [Sphingomonas folli]